MPVHCNSSTTRELGFASTLRGHQKNEIPKRCSLSVLFEPWLAQGNGLITAPSALWELRCLEDELPHRARVGQSSTARLQRSTQVLTWNSADLDEVPIHHHHGCEDGFRAPTYQATSFRAFENLPAIAYDALAVDLKRVAPYSAASDDHGVRVRSTPGPDRERTGPRRRTSGPRPH